MIRTPSILPGVPHYPNVHKAFKKSKVASSEEGNIANVNEEKQPEPLKGHGHNKSSKHSAQFQEKVEAIEFEEEAQTASSCGKNRKAEVPRESFDSKADGYIQKRHRRFELCTWATFKLQ